MWGPLISSMEGHESQGDRGIEGGFSVNKTNSKVDRKPEEEVLEIEICYYYFETFLIVFLSVFVIVCGCKGDQDLLEGQELACRLLSGGWQRHCADQLGIPADGGASAAALETRCLPRCVCLVQSDSQYFLFFPQWLFCIRVINSGNQLRLGGTKAWSG